MNNFFKRIIYIRNKIELYSFKKIYNKLNNEKMPFNKANFDIVSKEFWYKSNDSYTKYVKFIEYLLKKKQNENK